MKKLYLISVATLTFVFVAVLGVVFPLNALANPDTLEVFPTDHPFGDVQVGTTVTTFVRMTNINGKEVTVTRIMFQLGSNGDFSLVDPPTTEFDIFPGETVEIEVAFSPSATGYVSAVLEIESTDSLTPVHEVFFDGTGVGGPSEPLTIEDILEFFDLGVEAGTIQGTGPVDTPAQTNHLNVFKWKLLMVKFFLDKGADREACTLLWHAYDRSDGQLSPKDFIEGQDVPELNTMILQLTVDLGCQ